MRRCPCCNARLREQNLCARCKADLTLLNSTEQAAQFWLITALQSCLSGQIARSIAAITLSLNLKKTHIAIVFREFLIQQQCQEILDLLAQQQLLSARQRLYQVRHLFAHSQQLQQIRDFSDYLLVQNQSQPL